MKSLQAKIILFGVALTLLSGIFFSTYTLYQERKYILEGELERGRVKTLRVASAIEENVNDFASDVSFLAATPPIMGILRASQNQGVDPVDGSSLETWKDRLSVIFKEMLYSKNGFIQIRYIGVANGGQEIVRLDRVGNKILRVKESDLQKKEDRNYFKEAIQTGPNQVYFSTFDLNKERGVISYPLTLVFRGAIPIYEKWDKPFGFVIVNVDYSSIFKGLDIIDKDGQKLLITDESNNLLLTYSKNKIEFYHQEKREDISAIFKLTKVMGENGKVSLREGESSYYLNHSLAYDKRNPERKLNILLEVEKSVIFNKVLSSFKNDAFLLLLLLLFSLLTTYLFSRKLVKPINRLVQMTNDLALGKGNVVRKLALSDSNDEIGKLANTLITLSKDVFEANSQLENQKKALDSSAIVVETDTNGIITYVNEKFIEISGYSRSELLGQDHRIINSGYHDKEFFNNLWATIKRGQLWKGEIKNKAKGGHYYWVDTTIYPVMDSQGKLEKFIAIRVDITHQKLAEEKYENALSAKGEFLANMSHEIRTPLNGILGFTELLKEKEDLPRDVIIDIEHIHGCSKGLLAIVNDILDLSKMDAGKLALYPQATSLKEVCESALSLFIAKAKEKNINLNLIIKDDIPKTIFCDDLRLRQVLLNLIGNALKFTEENGNVHIKVERDQLAEDGEFYLKFSIKDDGLGIPLSKQEKLFESFHQADSSITKKFGGTGLGLTICAKIIQLFQGEISFESQEGVGSTFIFTIKTKKADSHLVKVNEFEGIVSNYPTIKKINVEEKRDLKILIVEDNPTNQKLILKYLKKLNFSRLDVADNGKVALEKAKVQDFDIILMDVQMPLVDGIQATKGIREGHGHQPIIIGISANAFEEDRKKGLDAGMNLYLSKPITPKKLKFAIEESQKIIEERKLAS